MALSKILENSITDGVVSAAKLKDFTAAVDLNGVELILDADQDTSITADTDDRIDFKIAGVEHISISNSSGDTVIKPMVDAKDIVFQQYDGNKIFEINDGNFVAVSGAAAGPGEIRIYEDTDNGTHYTGFKAGNNTASVAYVLPTADGSSGEQLTTDGSGTLSWSSAGTTLSNDANNRVVTGTGSGLNGEANLTFDGSTLAVTGATTISTNLDVDGTTNLDAVDIDGAVQLDATLTIGANDQGYDVILYGDTASANMTWDTSADDLIFNGAAGLIVPDGQFTLGSTAVTATAAEINLIDGGTSRGTTAIADGDGVLINDDGTMRQTNVTTLKTYMSDLTLTTAAQTNITSVGTLTALTVDDIALDGKVVTMTGSTSDTAVFTAGTNGTLSIVTTDAAAAAANITITADGTFEADGTTITLDSGGDIVLDADGADILFKDGGTTILTLTNSSTDVHFTVEAQDKDFKIIGDDGGSPVTAAIFDMSDAGTLVLNHDIRIADDGQIGSSSDADAMTIASGGAVTFSQNPVFPAGGVSVASLDIDGGTDIGAAIVDADLFIVDDGAGGTIRKAAASRLKTYIGQNTPAFEAHMSSNQELSDNTATKLSFNSENIDSDSTYDPSTNYRFTPAVVGKYFIYAMANFDAQAIDVMRRANLYLYKNGQINKTSYFDNYDNDFFYAISPYVATVVELDADDYVEIYAKFDTDGSSSRRMTAGQYTTFGAYKIIGA